MSDTDLIKDKLDIVDIIGEYVQLKPAGINHKGLCPFHREKTPSFMASRERKSWHCFGCQKGGDVFTFVQEIEGMEFIEALKFLAQRAGVELTGNVSNDLEKSQKNRLKDVMKEAARFYHEFLVRMTGAADARAYLKTRGLKDETIAAWQIGFIPDQWDLLTQYLLKKGVSIDDLVASGLTIKRDGANAASGRGFYDRFRGRIMFPIRDLHGIVVGFTGRVLVETENSGGKYVNTPETPLYHKSQVLFGLDKAKSEIRHADLAVLAEGQMDVIACHEAGMGNVIAASGTALTDEQIVLMSRYTKNIAMAFDADAAGESAAKRGIDLAHERGMRIKIIQIPEGKGKDPDECIRNNGDVWTQAVKDATDVMNWYIERAFANKNLSDPVTKQKIADTLLPEILRIPYAVEQDHWLEVIASRLRVDKLVLREDLKKIKPKTATKRDEPASQTGNTPAPPTQKERLAELYVELLLRFPELVKEPASQAVEQVLSTTSVFALYEAQKAGYTPLADSAATLALRSELDFGNTTLAEAIHEKKKIEQRLCGAAEKEKRELLMRNLSAAEAAGDKAQVTHLLHEFQSLS